MNSPPLHGIWRRPAVSSEALRDIPDIFTHADAAAYGISDRRLTAMQRTGEVDRLARGIYFKSGVDVDHDLAEIAVRAPKATLSSQQLSHVTT